MYKLRFYSEYYGILMSRRESRCRTQPLRSHMSNMSLPVENIIPVRSRTTLKGVLGFPFECFIQILTSSIPECRQVIESEDEFGLLQKHRRPM